MKPITSFCLILVSVIAAQAQDNIDRFILNRQYDEALNEIVQQLAQKPDAGLWLKQGLIYEKRMNYDDAIRSFSNACKIDSGSTIYWEELAEAHSALGNYLNAVACLQQAIFLDSTDLTLKGKLAQNYINLKAYRDAYECYLQIWQGDSTNRFYNRYFAYSAYRVGNNNLAVKLYEQLAASGSRDLNTWINLATIYVRQEKQNQAIATCERGLDLFPQNPSLFLKMADSYFLFRQYGKALQAYENYLATGDSIFNVLKNYGICLYFNKQEERAVEILDRCYLQTVNDPIVDFYLGACYKKLKQFDDSAGFLELAIETATPGYLAEIYHHLGQVYGMQRKFEASIGAYQKAMKIDPSKNELLFEIATTYEEFNANKTVALHYYREYLKAVGESGKNTDYALDRLHKIKEELFFDEGDHDSAIN